MARKKTHEEFVKNVYELVGDEYIVKGKYNGSKIKIEIEHVICKNTFTTKPNTFLNGHRCPVCSMKNRTGKTNEQFINEVYELVENEYTILDEYQKSDIKITIRHNKCDSSFQITPSDFLIGKRCPKCKTKNKNRKKRTTEEYKHDVRKLVGNEYFVLGEYVNNSTKIRMKHNKCDYEWEATPSSFLRGTRCPNCKGVRRISHNEFIKVVYNAFGDEYSVIGKYINKSTHVKIKHNLCDHEWEVLPSNLLRGRGCPKCQRDNVTNQLKKTHDIFVEEVYSIFGDEYSITDKKQYVNGLTHIEVIHNECGYKYNVTPNNLLRGRCCPNCTDSKNSKGIKAIKKYLNDNTITFTIEKTFDDCKSRHVLPFDIYLKSQNLIIEFDGEGHFNPMRFSKDKNKMIEKLHETQIHDRIKNAYCIKNNIPLVRIPFYQQENIEYILDHVLGYFKLIDKHDVDEKTVYKYLVNHYDWSHDQYIKKAN